MNMRERWIEFIYRIATGSKRARTILTPLGGLVFLTFVFLVILISLGVDWLLKLPKIVSRPFHLITAVPIIISGLSLALWSVYNFLKVKGTPVPLNPPPKLVITGPYAFARNPILTGLFIGLFGLGLILNSFSLMFIFTPLFILLNILELKFIEEPELEKRLGEPYIEYKKRVPMFIPRLSKTKKK